MYDPHFHSGSDQLSVGILHVNVDVILLQFCFSFIFYFTYWYAVADWYGAGLATAVVGSTPARGLLCINANSAFHLSGVG